MMHWKRATGQSECRTLGVSEDDAEPAGDYATRERALEAIYLAASNDIKKGHGVVRFEASLSEL
jgi:hypothetical protein